MRYIVTVLLLVITACTTGPTKQDFETKLQGWVGHDINDVLAGWGPPTSQFVMPNGNTLYSFKRSAGFNATAERDMYRQKASASSQEVYCTAGFVVSPEHVVTAYNYQGNDCYAQ